MTNPTPVTTTASPSRRFVQVTAVAYDFGVAVRTVRRRIATGDIKGARWFGRVQVIPRSEYDRILEHGLPCKHEPIRPLKGLKLKGKK